MRSSNLLDAANIESAEAGRPNHSLLLLGGATALLAAGYALGYLLRPGGEWERAGGHGVGLYLVATAVALLLFALMLTSEDVKSWRRSPLAGRPEKPIGQFVLEAKQARISLRVAREAYDLLRHHYPKPMGIDLADELRRDLRMSAEEIVSVRAGLLGRSDRIDNEPGAKSIGTVRQLLESVEAAPDNGVDRTMMRQRVADVPFDARPVVENLEFTEQSSLTDPDYLRRAHFKWVRRRDADYKGSRSRAGDEEQGRSHAGPYRRATELSRRLGVRQEAGRLAKLAEEKQTTTRANAGILRSAQNDGLPACAEMTDAHATRSNRPG